MRTVLCRALLLSSFALVPVYARYGDRTIARAAGTPCCGDRLLLAASEGDLCAVDRAASAGASLNYADATGTTALMIAAARGDQAMVERLLAGGADANARDRVGQTAMMRAMALGHRTVAATLVRYGADPTLRDRAGRTAADIAGILSPQVED